MRRVALTFWSGSQKLDNITEDVEYIFERLHLTREKEPSVDTSLDSTNRAAHDNSLPPGTSDPGQAAAGSETHLHASSTERPPRAVCRPEPGASNAEHQTTPLLNNLSGSTKAPHGDKRPEYQSPTSPPPHPQADPEPRPATENGTQGSAEAAESAVRPPRTHPPLFTAAVFSAPASPYGSWDRPRSFQSSQSPASRPSSAASTQPVLGHANPPSENSDAPGGISHSQRVSSTNSADASTDLLSGPASGSASLGSPPATVPVPENGPSPTWRGRGDSSPSTSSPGGSPSPTVGSNNAIVERAALRRARRDLAIDVTLRNLNIDPEECFKKASAPLCSCGRYVRPSWAALTPSPRGPIRRHSSALT